MKIAWYRIRQAVQVSWRWAFVVAGLLVAVLLELRKKTGGVADSIDGALNRHADAIAEANARAAVEIAAARAKDAAVTSRLKAIVANPDAAKRRRELIALRRRVEGRR